MRVAALLLTLCAVGAYAQEFSAPPLVEADDELSSADAGITDEGDAEAEAEHPSTVELSADGGYLYSADLSDELLSKLFVKDLGSLGSISVGLAEAGRLINGVQLPEGEAWTVVSPENAWGTQETIDALVTCAQAVHAKFPDASPLRVNHIGKRSGGYLRPHHSHQSGRDVDLGFYYRAGVDPGHIQGTREGSMELAANWALLRSLATMADVQVILLDRRVQKVLYDYALKQGEDPAWLDSIFRAGRGSLVQHARRHRDHFHVRFFSPRAQELGRRIQPLLAKRPDENLLVHRVKRGDTLGALALHYGSSVTMICRANNVKPSGLRVGRTLVIPLRGPCNNCPTPPPVVVPPRRLPPEPPVQASAQTG